LATVLIFSLAFRLFKSYKGAHFAFWIYLLFPYVTVFALEMFSESLATNFLLISSYLAISYKGKYYNLILIGALVCFSAFSRPYLILTIPLFAVFFILLFRKSEINLSKVFY